MIKIWGRNTSSNVQKVMWAIGEIGLPHERIDVGGAFGKNREPAYLAMNPNGLVPTLEEEDGFLLWESNSVVRYLAAKHKSSVLEPVDLCMRANAGKWMDWQLSVAAPAIFDCFWGLIRTAPEKRNHAAIEDSKKKTTAVADFRTAIFPSASWRIATASSFPIGRCFRISSAGTRRSRRGRRSRITSPQCR